MAQIHRQPDARGDDDRRLIDVTLADLRKLIASELQRAVRDAGQEEEASKSVKQAAKALGVGEPRLRSWCKDGCDRCGELMPSIMAGDDRGRRVYLSQARAWMAEHRSSEGCHA